MSTKIASLYAEISADTTKLERGLKETSADLKKTQGEMNKTGSAASSMAADFAKVGAVAAGIGLATKAVYDFARSGATLDMTRSKFDRLSSSVGTTADAMLTDLRTATRGMYSDMELVASATDFMSLGLAKSADQVVRLSKVSGALNMDMNQLVLTLTNQTTMRFDALGVSVDGFDERVQKLKDSGMDANAAFTEAFLQQAEAQIERVGEAADTSAGKFMQLEASAKNLTDQLRILAAETVAPVLDVPAGFLTDVNNAIKGIKNLTAEEKRAIQAQQQMAALSPITAFLNTFKVIEQLSGAFERNAQVAENSARSYTAMAQFYAGATTQITAATEAQEQQAKATEQTVGIASQLASEKRDYAKSVAEVTAEIDTALKQGYSESGNKVKGLREELKQLEDAHKEATQAIVMGFLEQKLAAEGNFDAVANLKLITGEWTQAEYDTARALEEAATAAGTNADKLAIVAANMERITKLAGARISMDVILNILQNMTKTYDPKAQAAFGSGDTVSQAGGGAINAGGWTLVGDRPGGALTPWSELISPQGMVYNANDTRALLYSGAVQRPRSAALSGEDGGGVFVGTGTTSTIKRASTGVISTVTRTGDASGEVMPSAAATATVTSVASQAATQAVAPVATAVGTSVQIATQSQAQTEALAAQIAQGNDQTTQLLSQLVNEQRKTRTELFTAFRDAVQQAVA